MEMMRLQGMSLDAIANHFDLGAGGRDAIWRHMKAHVSEDDKAFLLADVPLAEAAARAAKEDVSLLDYLSLVRSALVQQVRLAAEVNDRHGLAAVSGKAIDCLREIGKLTGQLREFAGNLTINQSVTFMASPAFAELQCTLIRALQPYPEALSAVVKALEGMDGPEAPEADDDGRTLSLTAGEGYHADAA
jgi:hypothetical protein